MFKLLDGDFPQNTAFSSTFNNSFLVVINFLHVKKTKLTNNVKEVRRLSKEEIETYIYNYKFALYSNDLKKSLNINSNVVTFECTLQDGRKFVAIDEMITFYTLQKLASEYDTRKVEIPTKDEQALNGIVFPLAIIAIVLIASLFNWCNKTNNLPTLITLTIIILVFLLAKKYKSKRKSEANKQLKINSTEEMKDTEVSEDIYSKENKIQHKEVGNKFLNICKKILLNNVVRNLFGYIFLFSAIAGFVDKEIGVVFGTVLFIFAILTIPKCTLFIEETLNKRLPNWLKLLPTTFLLSMMILSQLFIASLSLIYSNPSDKTSNTSQLTQKKSTKTTIAKTPKAKKHIKSVQRIIEQGIPDAQAEAMFNTLKSCGIKGIDSISKTSAVGYTIKPTDINGEVYLYLKENNKKKIESIYFADEDLYKNGKVVASINDFIISDDEKLHLQISSEDYVRNYLKSPSTAQFPNYYDWNIYKKKGAIFAESYVDAQNSFGAPIRSYFKIKVVNNNVVKFSIDGKNIL